VLGRIGETPFHAVRSFIEKPSADTARACLAAGAIWNTFVFVAKVSALAVAGRRGVPRVLRMIERLMHAAARGARRDVLQRIGTALPPANFSRDVLQNVTPTLAVATLTGVPWCDWGSPRRVVASMERLGIQAVMARSRHRAGVNFALFNGHVTAGTLRLLMRRARWPQGGRDPGVGDRRHAGGPAGDDDDPGGLDLRHAGRIGIRHEPGPAGGNITGLSLDIGCQMGGKRLEILKAAFPMIARYAVIWNPTNAATARCLPEEVTMAAKLGVTRTLFEVRTKATSTGTTPRRVVPSIRPIATTCSPPAMNSSGTR
jgi:hypothetical protein